MRFLQWRRFSTTRLDSCFLKIFKERVSEKDLRVKIFQRKGRLEHHSRIPVIICVSTKIPFGERHVLVSGLKTLLSCDGYRWPIPKSALGGNGYGKIYVFACFFL